MADIRLSKICNICPLICSLWDEKPFSVLFVFCIKLFTVIEKTQNAAKVGKVTVRGCTSRAIKKV